MKTEWLYVIIGVMIGEFSHFGRQIHDIGWPSPKQIVGYTFQMGFIALLAGVVVERLGIKSELGIAVTAAVFALSAQEVMPWLKDRAGKMLEAIGFKL